jgi:colicin import membrane protein
MSIEQEIEWMQKKSRAEMDIAAAKAAFERGVKDDDAKADNLRKRKTLEDDELLKADYDLQLFEKKHALEIAQDIAATAKSKNAAEKSKADAEKKTADRIAAEERLKLAKTLRAAEDEKQKREEEMEAAYAKAEYDFIHATGDTARADARNKLDRTMKRKHPDLSQRTRTMRINKLISKPKK